VGARIAARAAALVGVPSVKAVAGDLPDDCTGLVREAYRHEGIDLMAWDPGRKVNGVTAMYLLARRTGALHRGAPQPGDLAFFRETYDRDRDGRRDDGYTHVVVVESVDADGTVTFVHRSGRGITRERMNLARPHDRAVNDYLRRKGRKTAAALAGELFVGYASADRLAAGIPERTGRR
jgi:hypothetical protein